MQSVSTEWVDFKAIEDLRSSFAQTSFIIERHKIMIIAFSDLIQANNFSLHLGAVGFCDENGTCKRPFENPVIGVQLYFGEVIRLASLFEQIGAINGNAFEESLYGHLTASRVQDLTNQVDDMDLHPSPGLGPIR